MTFVCIFIGLFLEDMTRFFKRTKDGLNQSFLSTILLTYPRLKKATLLHSLPIIGWGNHTLWNGVTPIVLPSVVGGLGKATNSEEENICIPSSNSPSKIKCVASNSWSYLPNPSTRTGYDTRSIFNYILITPQAPPINMLWTMKNVDKPL